MTETGSLWGHGKLYWQLAIRIGNDCKVDWKRLDMSTGFANILIENTKDCQYWLKLQQSCQYIDWKVQKLSLYW